MDDVGNLRGTTSKGRAFEYGTVFEIDTAGTETVLHSFKCSTGYGVGPEQIVVGSAGNLYGVTSGGGAYNGGTVFRIDASGTEALVHSFQSFVTTLNGPGDGSQPTDIVADGAANLCGTTAYGGAYGLGTVLKIDTAGTTTPLYSFEGATPDTSSDGSDSVALIRDSAGNIYGTTATGGGYNAGALFKIGPAGTETILYSCGSASSDDGIIGPLVMDGGRNIYATTEYGAADNLGAVFKIDPTGTATVLCSFTDQGSDGALPRGLITDSAGNLYGTTASGGAYNYGMVIKLDSAGAETVLYSFKGGAAGGASPTGLIMDSTGNFYATTAGGGAYGHGTVVQIASAGTETVLYSFRGGTVDGSAPTGLAHG